MSTNDIADAFDNYIHQALDRTFATHMSNASDGRQQGPKWYDRELRLKRSAAIKAGENNLQGTGNGDLVTLCREYRSTKQRKQREYKRKCLESIEYAYKYDKHSMWGVLKNIDRDNRITAEPSDSEFYEYFKSMSSVNDLDYFDNNYEQEAKLFLEKYANSNSSNYDSDITKFIINQNFSTDEIKSAIDALKNNKSPGIDAIPVEFVKYCKDILAEDITMIVNYVVEERNFPDVWTEGLRSAVFKSGKHNFVNNYRGITILPIMEKIFELAVYRRLTFANESMGQIDKYNGGFINGCRTSDNMFILLGLIQRQMIMGEPLYICFVDFSKAFDLVNRHILFFKIMKGGWSGRVIDTLKDLYSKTCFRVKRGGKLSPVIPSLTGVNQGGVASGILFRKYLMDLDVYLKKEVGICIGETIVAHLLWADDLMLFSNTEKGLQKQLDGLKLFCANNKMIVNETKTKLMIFGKDYAGNVSFNSKKIELVKEYKYLGNIIRSTTTNKQDIFSLNYIYLRDRANRAMFAVLQRLKNIETPPPEIMFHIFDTLIMPILTYGSDVWGYNKMALSILDKVFLRSVRCTLGIKCTTSNIIVLGECGRMPPSVMCTINTLCFLNRLMCMNDDSLVKQVYVELQHLTGQGFDTWVSSTGKLAASYQLDLYMNPIKFRNECKNVVRSKFINQWAADIANITKNPILRTYRNIKLSFGTEPYIYLVKDRRYRHAISRLRCSSHILHIEKGRYTRPRTPLHERLCYSCNCVEDELHFVIACSLNRTERIVLYDKVARKFPEFDQLADVEKFVFLFTFKDAQMLTWLGKFLYKSFRTKSSQ